jgi:hypothetical protein
MRNSVLLDIDNDNDNDVLRYRAKMVDSTSEDAG